MWRRSAFAWRGCGGDRGRVQPVAVRPPTMPRSRSITVSAFARSSPSRPLTNSTSPPVGRRRCAMSTIWCCMDRMTCRPRCFFGAEQYERVQFSGDQFIFQGRALHLRCQPRPVQYRLEGRQDNPHAAGWMYNTRQPLPAISKLRLPRSISPGFWKATLHNELGYLPLFRDHRSAPDLRISAKPNAHFRLMPITRFGVKPNGDFDAEGVGTA
jgi:hypothetical protein